MKQTIRAIGKFMWNCAIILLLILAVGAVMVGGFILASVLAGPLGIWGVVISFVATVTILAAAIVTAFELA